MADAVATRSEICEWCISYLAKELKVPASEIDPQADFARLGIDSAASIFFIMDLEERLDLELPVSIVVEHSSIAKLAGYLAQRLADRSGAAPRAS